ncbi:hypothetical protein HDV00_009911 [Rhizophlyctis rosea]|nr:hypothetical protein HDV00_009911 [Rhizophlyctis rosea]
MSNSGQGNLDSRISPAQPLDKTFPGAAIIHNVQGGVEQEVLMPEKYLGVWMFEMKDTVLPSGGNLSVWSSPEVLRDAWGNKTDCVNQAGQDATFQSFVADGKCWRWEARWGAPKWVKTTCDDSGGSVRVYNDSSCAIEVPWMSRYVSLGVCWPERAYAARGLLETKTATANRLDSNVHYFIMFPLPIEVVSKILLYAPADVMNHLHPADLDEEDWDFAEWANTFPEDYTSATIYVTTTFRIGVLLSVAYRYPHVRNAIIPYLPYGSIDAASAKGQIDLMNWWQNWKTKKPTLFWSGGTKAAGRCSTIIKYYLKPVIMDRSRCCSGGKDGGFALQWDTGLIADKEDENKT